MKTKAMALALLLSLMGCTESSEETKSEVKKDNTQLYLISQLNLINNQLNSIKFNRIQSNALNAKSYDSR